MKKFPVTWTRQARRDLLDVKRYISRDAPSTAKAFIQRIKDRVKRIGVMPTAGSPVPEAETADVREIFVGSYRIIYRVRQTDVRVLVVMHGARLLPPGRLHAGDE